MLRLFRRTGGAEPVARIDVAHDGCSYAVALKRARNARRFTLRVRAATRDVVLTMPLRGSLGEARAFAQRHAAWIGARLARLPDLVPFAPDAIVPIRGLDHRIAHRPDARGVVWRESDAGAPEGARDLLCVAGAAAHLDRRMRDFLRREARHDLEASVKRHCASAGVAARKVSVRDTTSRWGSCSATGALNFSWRLVLAPPFVLDYLAAHEVAHLVHMDHSPKFWALTRRLAPHTERAEAWLKARGATLYRYGAREASTPAASLARKNVR